MRRAGRTRARARPTATANHGGRGRASQAALPPAIIAIADEDRTGLRRRRLPRSRAAPKPLRPGGATLSTLCPRLEVGVGLDRRRTPPSKLSETGCTSNSSCVPQRPLRLAAVAHETDHLDRLHLGAVARERRERREVGVVELVAVAVTAARGGFRRRGSSRPRRASRRRPRRAAAPSNARDGGRRARSRPSEASSPKSSLTPARPSHGEDVGARAERRVDHLRNANERPGRRRQLLGAVARHGAEH